MIPVRLKLLRHLLIVLTCVIIVDLLQNVIDQIQDPTIIVLMLREDIMTTDELILWTSILRLVMLIVEHRFQDPSLLLLQPIGPEIVNELYIRLVPQLERFHLRRTCRLMTLSLIDVLHRGNCRSTLRGVVPGMKRLIFVVLTQMQTEIVSNEMLLR